jgi:hypothetical protein
LGISLLACSPAQAKPKFNASNVAGRSSDLLVCDLDGDGLKDLVLMDDFNLSIFYQTPTSGFTREPQQTFRLEPRPCLVWTAKLGRPAGSLLVMTSDGVTELCFTNRTGTPAIRQIIRQPTVVPAAAESTNAICLPLSVETGGAWPLLLVPAADGLQVWQHREEWRQAQLISQAIEAHLWPSLANPGYTRSLEFDLSVGDVNGDGRDDLIVRRSHMGLTNTYRLYLQQTNGLFALEPALTYGDKVERFSWLCWADLNHDGKVDLIKSVWLNEPSFVPGVPGGKVLVSTYIADEHGRLPAQPQQIFRKNDWLSLLPVVDVDGDGKADLLVRDHSEGISVYFFVSRQKGFSAEPDLRFSCPEPIEEWRVVDLNNDGVSDLIVKLANENGYRIFISRK